MEERMYGEHVTLDCRAEAHEKVDKQKRYAEIISCLKEVPQQTAKEIAMMMWQRGYVPTGERNFSQPRLNELATKGVVDTVGKKICEYTGRKVTVYQLRDEC